MAADAKDKGVQQPKTSTLATDLAAAIKAVVPASAAHGALLAVEMALADLKARVASVEEHLRTDYADMITRIKAL